MSQPRQTHVQLSHSGISGLSLTREAGLLPNHIHPDQAQLLYASSGMMTVTTPAGRWILPAGRALWISAGTEHGLEVRRPVALKILYFQGDIAGIPRWKGCVVVNVTPLLRELIGVCVDLPPHYPANSAEARLLRVLVDQLSAMDQAPVDLPQPRDARAVRVAQLAAENAADRRPLHILAQLAGASTRTVERLFVSETGMSFGAWRHRLRMIAALEQLAEGQSVANAGDAVGYDNPSSFIAAFRAMFGNTPGRYFDLL